MSTVPITPTQIIHQIGSWIEQEWLPTHNTPERITLMADPTALYGAALRKFKPTFRLAQGFQFKGTTPIPCPIAPRVHHASEAQITFQTGANLHHFVQRDTGETIDVLVVAALHSPNMWDSPICLACLPETFLPVWYAFEQRCHRIAYARAPEPRVTIVGGRSHSFVPVVDWDDVILPAALKHDILSDVQSFFDRGIGVYKRLKLKPFRKILLTGVPGTGKTMLCAALAKWAIARRYPVIYISSADCDGPTFNKIEQALAIASYSRLPVMIILEEFDAYLQKPEEKAIVLNVLDGAESAINDRGTLLVATTNYPEAIDERVMKRPGRLDRIFVIPQVKRHDDAERMLRQYLGDMWRDEHMALVPQLIDYPGAFIREVAISTLTQVALYDVVDVPLSLLQESYERLKAQIEAKNEFLVDRANTTNETSADASLN